VLTQLVTMLELLKRNMIVSLSIKLTLYLDSCMKLPFVVKAENYNMESIGCVHSSVNKRFVLIVTNFGHLTFIRSFRTSTERDDHQNHEL